MVSTVTQLDSVRNYLDSHFILTADLDLDVDPYDNAGWVPIGTVGVSEYFTGTFDGQAHSIAGLYIDLEEDFIGLFGAISSTAEILNLHLTNASVTGRNTVGILVGFNDGVIDSCSSSGRVFSTGTTGETGGLVGESDFGSSVLYSTSSAKVSGSEYTGGLIGYNSGMVTNSSASGNVDGTNYVGGLAGINSDASISGSFASGNVDGAQYVGGLAGENNVGTISKSYATGDVNASTFAAGGLVGRNNDGFIIENSYATGNVMGASSVGGLVGVMATGIFSGDVKETFSIGLVTGESGVGGLIGGGPGTIGTISNSFWNTTASKTDASFGGIGLTAEQMTQSEFYNGFDFTESGEFDIVEGHSLPFLRGISEEVTLAIEISGQEGWRMMGTPFADSLRNFFAQFWTQGIPGSDSPNDDPNIYKWDEAQQSFVTPASMDEVMVPGLGQIIHIFEDDDPTDEDDTDEFPKWKYQEASLGVDSVVVPIKTTDANDNDMIDGNEGWIILGNPFGSALSVDALFGVAEDVDPGVNGNLYVWNSQTETYDTFSEGEMVSLSPLQAFFFLFQAVDLNTEMVLKLDDLASTGGQFQKQKKEEPGYRISITVEGGEHQRVWESLFQPEASRRRNVYYLPPLAQHKLSFFSTDERGKYIRQFLDPESAAEFEIPLFLETSTPGDYFLAAEMDFPSDWAVVLFDHHTGLEVDLRKESNLHFEIDSQSKKGASPAFLASGESAAVLLAPAVLKSAKATSPRFSLTIRPSAAVSNEPVDDLLPRNIALSQNYPNPFNPSTVIGYQLPVSSEVSLKVYDMLGREVTTLINGRIKAGYHQVNFYAHSLASGTYFYQLRIDNTILTKKLTLIK